MVNCQSAGTKRVLVVDDQPSATQLLRLSLEERGGYEVREVNDPHAALKAASEFRPDLVLMDVEMPTLDGRAAACLLQADPDLADTPVLFVTGKIEEDDAAQHNPFGWAGVLKKPFSKERLFIAVEKALSSQRAGCSFLPRSARA